MASLSGFACVHDVDEVIDRAARAAGQRCRRRVHRDSCQPVQDVAQARRDPSGGLVAMIRPVSSTVPAR